MTTIDGVLTPHDEPHGDAPTELTDAVTPVEDVAPEAVVRRPRMWLRMVAGFVIGFALAIGLAAGALVAYDASHEGLVLAGVSVGGVDVSGQSYDQASATLQAAYEGYGSGEVVVATSAGDITVPYADFDRRPDIAAMVDEAMAAGRSGTPFERAVEAVRLVLAPVVVEPRLVLDEAALARRIQAAIDGLERRPVDATIVMTRQGIRTTPARPGRTFDADVATAAALASVREREAPSTVTVDAPATAISPEHDTSEVLLAKAAAQQMIADIKVKLGKKSWTIKASAVRRWIHFEMTAHGAMWPVIDERGITASLKRVAKAVKRDAVSAKYLKTNGGRIVGVVAAIDGRRLNTAGTATAIADALAARAGGAPAPAVKVRTIKVEPKLTTAEAVQRGPLMVELGSWKTWFPISERNYFGANIWQPARMIDGLVLRPGQRFEWWSAIGPVTPARGYGAGGFIAGSRTEPTGALGGGMCSSSTTLFNAALRAGLRMGARDNHKYYIDRYPLGLDATVSKTRGGGGQTMTFFNDMDDPIVIRSFRYRSGGTGWVRYEIWGIPDGRRVSFSRPSVSNVRKATTNVVYTSRLPKGVREQVEYPANGMNVSVTRVVKSKSGRVLHRETYTSNYVLWNGRIEIGR